MFPDLLIPLAALAFVGLGLWALSGRPFSQPLTAGSLCSVSLIVAETTKGQLKFVFGRLRQETWVARTHRLSTTAPTDLTSFTAGKATRRSPSGHTAATCALVSVLWMLYPRLRPL